MPDKYLSTTEAARHLGVSPSTLRTWRSEERGPRFLKFGNTVIYERSVIEDYARSLKGGAR